MISKTPTEDQEQMRLVAWLRKNKLPHFRVPNETYTTSWSQKRKNKALGVVAGTPDLFVIAGGKMLAIELKRVKGGRPTPAQIGWIETLKNNGVPAKICYGADEAKEFVQSFSEKKLKSGVEI